MCNDRASFQSFKRLPTPCEIRLGDGHVVHAFYHGLVELHVDLIVDALYVPEFQLSLLSVRRLDCSGIDTRINNDTAHLFHSTSHTTPFLEAPAIETNLCTLQLTPRPDVPPVDTMTSVQIATTRSQAAAQKQAAEPEPPLSMQINFAHRLTTFVALGVCLGRLSLKSNVAIRTLALVLVAA
jgi:hypothetical protein